MHMLSSFIMRNIAGSFYIFIIIYMHLFFQLFVATKNRIYRFY